MDKILKFETYSDLEDYIDEISYFSGKIETGSLFQIGKTIFVVKDYSNVLKKNCGPCEFCSFFSSCKDYACPFEFQACANKLSEIDVLILTGGKNA